MIKDFYSRKAKQDGYLARSAYKLKQLNNKYHLIKRNNFVLDLGCFPGGWVQSSIEAIGSTGTVIGIDEKDVDFKHKQFIFYKLNVFNNEVLNLNNKFDVVLSDLAPRTTGIKELDRARSSDLAFQALNLSIKKLKHNGNFLVKIFQGRDFISFLNECKKHFNFVKCDKPEASKKKSVEMYVVCIGFIK